MPTTATTCRPIATALGHQERKVLHAVGCGLRDDEIAAALALSRTPSPDTSRGSS